MYKICLGLLIFCGLTAVVLQTDNVGFNPGHYGWVTSHNLAVFKNASPNNGFLGFALDVISANGNNDKLYFDRYPVIFSGLMNRIMAFKELSLSEEIALARLTMNILFALSMLIAYRLLHRIFLAPLAVTAAICLTFGSCIFLFYKDMVHFDQPAMFAMLLLFDAITRYELNQDHKKNVGSLFLIAIFAATFGRGYAAVFTLGVWFIFRWWQHRQIFHDIAFRVAAVCVVVSAASLATNIYRESLIRNLPLLQTSIVTSATARLGVKKSSEFVEHKARFSKSLLTQIERFFLNSVPGLFGGPHEVMRGLRKGARTIPGIILLLAILGIFLYVLPKYGWRAWKELSNNQKHVGKILIFSGIVWCVVMRKLTAFHEYTAYFLLGTNLYIWALFLTYTFKKISIRKQLALTGFVVLLFLSSVIRIEQLHNSEMSEVNEHTEDFESILQILGPESKNIFVEGNFRKFIPGAPYALGYYLHGHKISISKDYAQFELITTPTSKNLTPHNKHFYLQAIK